MISLKNIVLTAALALSSGMFASSCGPSIKCQNNTDCKEGSTCTYHQSSDAVICVDAFGNPESVEDYSAENSCGNSPLTGRFLINSSCDLGSSTPFRESPCEGHFNNKRGGFSLSYSGMTLHLPHSLFDFNENEGDVPIPTTLHMRRDITPADFPDFGSYEENYEDHYGVPPSGNDFGPDSLEYGIYLANKQEYDMEVAQIFCLMTQIPNFYFAHEEGKELSARKDLFFWLTDEPWYDKLSCRASNENRVYKDEINAACIEQYPFPECGGSWGCTSDPNKPVCRDYQCMSE